MKRRTLQIDRDDLVPALEAAVEKSDETIQNMYATAVRSTKPKNQYKQVLLSCALAAADLHGHFSAAAVRDPFSKIMGRRMEIPAFARHLSEFCDSARGPALIKEGKPKSFENRFADPLLRPFVVIEGMKQGLIPE